MTETTTALAAFAAFLTAIATIILAYFNRETLKTVEAQATTMRDQYNSIQRQAEIMEKQSNLMYQNMEYDRLLKQHERLFKEMTLFVGQLFARRNDSGIFKLKKRDRRVHNFGKGGIDQETYDYITFWDTIDQNVYLNQSEVLRSALNKYNAALAAYFEAKPDYVKTLEDEFNENIKPDLIRTIEKRYSELDDELKKIEQELKIR